MDSPRSKPASLPNSNNPSLLSIPTPSSNNNNNAASSSYQSPTTPTNAPTANPIDSLQQYHIAPGQSSSVDAALNKDEQALHNLTADDVHNPKPSTMGNVAEQSAMEQVLSGVLAMQKEVSLSLLESIYHSIATKQADVFVV